MESLCDDLNTPSMIARLHAMAGEIRASASGLHQIDLKRKLKASGSLIGILGQTEREYIECHPLRIAIDESKVKSLIDARAHARKTKNFKQADLIRDELTNMGIEIEDRRDGTTSWKLKWRAS
jgi:cysteinyl-tRNA synthetase